MPNLSVTLTKDMYLYQSLFFFFDICVSLKKYRSVKKKGGMVGFFSIETESMHTLLKSFYVRKNSGTPPPLPLHPNLLQVSVL